MFDKFRDMGFKSGNIELAYTGITVELRQDFYRDDGVVQSIAEHKQKIAADLGKKPGKIEDPSDIIGINENGVELIKGGEIVTYTAVIINDDNSRDYSRLFVKILKEMLSEDKTLEDAWKLLRHGHEEGHIIQNTAQMTSVQPWLFHRGYESLWASLWNEYNYGDKETVCDMIGAVLVESEGFSVESLYPHREGLSDICLRP